MLRSAEGVTGLFVAKLAVYSQPSYRFGVTNRNARRFRLFPGAGAGGRMEHMERFQGLLGLLKLIFEYIQCFFLNELEFIDVFIEFYLRNSLF